MADKIICFDVDEEMLCIYRSGKHVQIYHLLTTESDSDKKQLSNVIRLKEDTGLPKRIAFSVKQDFLVCALDSGLIGVIRGFQQSQSLEYYETLNGAVLTELILADGAFYVGTNDGVVSKFQWDESNDELEVTRVLELRSCIFQMDWNTPLGLLVVSSTSRTVVCNTKLKTFSEVGKAARNGKFGACILAQNPQEPYLITARPHQKIWTASINGKILQKYSFNSAKIRTGVESTSKPKSRTIFSKLYSNMYSSRILTYNGKSIFVIDLEGDTPIILRKMPNNILHIKLVNNRVYVLDTAGNLYSIDMEDGTTCSPLVLEEEENKEAYCRHQSWSSSEEEEAEGSSESSSGVVYSGYLETLFRLDSDLLSAELTGQAASLLTEKFSTTGKVAKQKLIRFSRLQHWLPGESTNEDDEEKAVLDLQNKNETIEPLLNEILKKSGQVDYHLDFLEDVCSSWQNLVDHDLLSLIKEATTVILKAHFESTLWKQYLHITNYEELYEEYKDVLSPSMLKIILDMSEKSDHECLSIMTSTVSLMNESFHDEASDFLANYGFCLTIHELLSFTFLLCYDTSLEELKQSESPAENYEGALDWLSKYHGCSVTAAMLIVMAKKLIDGDTLVFCPNEEECLRHMFTHIYPYYGDKIEALDTLGFHLMLSNGAFKPLDFCKNAQFWRGYQRLFRNLSMDERDAEIPFLLDLKKLKFLQLFIELSDDDNRQCLKLVQAAIEKQYFDLESLLMTMLSFKGAKMIKKLLMEDVSTNLPKAAFSPLFYNLLIQSSLLD